MSVSDMTLKTGATHNVTGGSDNVFKPDGLTIQNGVHVVCVSDSDQLTRKTLTAKVKPSVVDAKTGKMSKDRKSILVVQPIQLSTGEVVYPLLRIEREAHPAMSDEQVNSFNELGSQILVGTACSSFWTTGQIA